MCAINGITTNDVPLVLRMNEQTKHRGPDGSHTWEGNGVTLGHNRLAIIDLSSAALQPMTSTTGRFTIVFNGEIYNYRELRAELVGGYTFKTHSDTEVLLAAYETWGRNMLPKLRGIFSFGIWDSREGTLLLVRDHMGVKPLYYRFQNGILQFSSELTGLISEHCHTLNTQALALYMQLQYAPSEHTLVQGIKKLAPGHMLIYKKGSLERVAYHDPFEVETTVQNNVCRNDIQNKIRSTISTAVKRQLVSDRPIGMFLSGGLDSSIVLHHMTQHATDVRTFSVDFEMISGAESEEKKFNTDAVLGTKTAAHYGAHHTTFTLTIDDVRTNIESALQALDEPVANATAISQYLLSKWVREAGVVVALGGDGGDELFGGYTRHRMAMAAYWYQTLPHRLQTMIGHIHPRLQKLSTPLGAPMHLMLMADKVALRHTLFTHDIHMREETVDFFTQAYTSILETLHPIDAFMRVDRATWLPDESLARSDRSSMAHGLELRVPLLDLDVVKYSDTIPVHLKTNPWKGKNILRHAYQGMLPEYLFHQPKRGWVSPGAKWLRDPEIMRFAREVLSSHYYSGISGVNWVVVQKLLEDHIEKRGYYLYPLWNILVLQIWARKHNVTMN